VQGGRTGDELVKKRLKPSQAGSFFEISGRRQLPFHHPQTVRFTATDAKTGFARDGRALRDDDFGRRGRPNALEHHGPGSVPVTREASATTSILLEGGGRSPKTGPCPGSKLGRRCSRPDVDARRGWRVLRHERRREATRIASTQAGRLPSSIGLRRSSRQTSKSLHERPTRRARSAILFLGGIGAFQRESSQSPL